ncbi:MAG TPA: hypothetical protein VNZ53_17690 [Steroidobacteraceae bacterium]|nr:hypothetical protein [Steroidobacteraceae bacterium]
MTFGRAAPINSALFHNGACDLMLAAVIRHLLMEDSIGCGPIPLLQWPCEVGLNDHWVVTVRNLDFDGEHFVSTGNQTDPFFRHSGVPVQFGRRWCLNIAKTTKVLPAAIAVEIYAIGRRAQFGLPTQTLPHFRNGGRPRRPNRINRPQDIGIARAIRSGGASLLTS